MGDAEFGPQPIACGECYGEDLAWREEVAQPPKLALLWAFAGAEVARDPEILISQEAPMTERVVTMVVPEPSVKLSMKPGTAKEMAEALVRAATREPAG